MGTFCTEARVRVSGGYTMRCCSWKRPSVKGVKSAATWRASSATCWVAAGAAKATGSGTALSLRV